MKKIILFDLDGTLADVQPIEKLVLAKILKNRNVVFSGRSSFDLVRQLVGLDETEFYLEYAKCFEILKIKNSLPIPKMLIDIRKFCFEPGCCLGLVTGSVRKEAKWVLEKLGIKACFSPDLVMCREDYYREKKSGEPYQKMKDIFPNVLIVAVGDTRDDLLGSRVAGLDCCLVSRRAPRVKNENKLEEFFRKYKLLSK